MTQDMFTPAAPPTGALAQLASTLMANDCEPIWLFDLDNTLYSAECDVFTQIEARMSAYIERTFSLSPAEALALRQTYFQHYGTTLAGLMACHEVDPTDFLRFVHDIDLSGIAAIPELAQALTALSGRRIIFTNASTHHAERVLESLGLASLFEEIVAIETTDYIPKPALDAYHRAIALTGLDPSATVFFEDTVRNLKPAASLGMQTVLVETAAKRSQMPAGEEDDFIHHRTEDLAAWLRQAAQLLQGSL